MEQLTYRNILRDKSVTDAAGVSVPLHSNSSLEQCEFLQELIRQIDAKNCIEIGLAYAVSSLAICEAIHNKEAASFISIDPFQERDWNNVGLLNLDRAGFRELTTFYPDLADKVLPRLLSEGIEIDFAYVDGSKVFDSALVHSHYLLKMVRIGGVIVFDDCGFPGVARAVRWIASLPHVKVLARHGELKFSLKRSLFSKIARLTPGGNRIFRSELLECSEAPSISASCIALMKTGEDDRPWDWDFPL